MNLVKVNSKKKMIKTIDNLHLLNIQWLIKILHYSGKHQKKL